MSSIEIVEKRVPRINKWDTATPAVGRCVCGHLVVLQDNLTNDCDGCHRAYNLVGNEVKSTVRQQNERDDYRNEE